MKNERLIFLTQKANKSQQFVKNLSDSKLSLMETIALGRGLNFIPTPPKKQKNSYPTPFKTALQENETTRFNGREI